MTTETNLRVLHLEDNLADAELIREKLRESGLVCEQDRVDRRDDFVRAIENNQYDLIFSDFTMPGFNGLSALKIAREKAPTTPFIFVSGTIGEALATESLKNGACDFVLKDRLARLIPAVRRALQEAQQKTRIKTVADSIIQQIELIDQTGLAISMRDSSHKITLWNRGAEKLYGWTREEALGKNYFALLNRQLPAPLPEITEILQRDSQWHGELVQKRKDQTRLVVHSRWTLRQADPNADEAILVIDEDISTRKATDAILQTSEERYRGLFEDDVTAIFMAGADGRFIACNRAFALLLGFNSVEEVMEESLFSLLPPTAAGEGLAAYLQNTSSVSFPSRHVRRVDGKMTLVNGSLTGIFDGKNNLTAIKGYLQDLTELQRLTMTLASENKTSSIATLAEGVAQDFNNILGYILGHVHLLSREAKNPSRVAEIAASITRAGLRGGTLVRQLLTFAQDNEKRFSQIDLEKLLDDLIGTFADTLPANITVHAQLPSKTTYLYGDPSQLRYLLLDLCLHAASMMPQGGILALRTREVTGAELRCAFPDAQQESYLAIDIADSCGPMLESLRRQMLESFTLPGQEDDQEHDSGLDLAVAFATVNQHRGFMDVSASGSHSAAFHIYFPLTPPQPRSMGRHQQTDMETFQTPGAILVIEDEETPLYLLKSYLAAQGYRILIARSGSQGQALYQAHRSQIDLVLGDLGALRQDGFAAYKAMQELNPNVKVLMAAETIDPSFKASLKEMGIYGFVEKPYDPREVLQDVRSALKPTAGSA